MTLIDAFACIPVTLLLSGAQPDSLNRAYRGRGTSLLALLNDRGNRIADLGISQFRIAPMNPLIELLTSLFISRASHRRIVFPLCVKIRDR